MKTQNDSEGKDICYGCGKVGEYGTMKDIHPNSFAIYCKKCWKKMKTKNDSEGKDICYGCGKIGEHGTMKDIYPISIAIYCKKCWKKRQKSKK